jgi:hypothetical protein
LWDESTGLSCTFLRTRVLDMDGGV